MNQNLLSKKKKGDISLEDVFLAYFDCRKNKRNKTDALEFELDFEKELIKLWKEINDRSYRISPLDVFISDKPVKREIFAAQFRDRIVHHLIINKLNYLFEKEFIYDTYSCRKGKGVHFGIKRVKKFMRQCSENYQKNCYILKMDIKGYFMSINSNILLEKLEKFINRKYFGEDRGRIIWLCRVIINNDSIINCTRKSAKRKWTGLPKSKSLFYAEENCGLPIGNYTNQVFANFYLNSLDHFIKHKLRTQYYARYVDDFLIISKSRKKLKEKIPLIEEFLNENLKLKLHPKKTYFQHHKKGLEFLGTLIKPWRSYVSSRIKNNFYETIETINDGLEKEKLNEYEKRRILSQINSYLGVTSHMNSYKLRKAFLSKFEWRFWGYFRATNDFSKIIFNKKGKERFKNRLSQEKRKNNKRQKSISNISVISLSLRKQVSV